MVFFNGLLGVLLLCAIVVLESVSFGAQFLPLTDVTCSCIDSSFVQDVSNDGTTVIGALTDGGVTRPFRWRLDGNLLPLLGPANEDLIGVASAISQDGSKVLGMSGSRPFLWDQNSGVEYLDFLPGEVYDMTPDADIIVGQVVGGSSGSSAGFRWQMGQGVQLIADPEGGEVGVRGISDDGSTVVGSRDTISNPRGNEAFRWSQAHGFEDLGTVAQNASAQSYGWAASHDGGVVVGSSSVATGGNSAMRWSSATGMIDLGDLDGGELGSFAEDVTPDGKIVVGSSVVRDMGVGDFTRLAPFIWTPELGMRNLADMVASESVGWQLSQATAVSADGRVISGVGYSPAGKQVGWVIRLEPSEVWTMPGDFNRDRSVDAADYTVWRDNFGRIVPPFTPPDANGDGFIQSIDYDMWKAGFGTSDANATLSHTQVPEPPSIVAAALSLLMVFRCRTGIRRLPVHPN